MSANRNVLDLSLVPLARPGDFVTVERVYSTEGEQYSVTLAVGGKECTGWGDTPSAAFDEAVSDWRQTGGES